MRMLAAGLAAVCAIGYCSAGQAEQPGVVGNWMNPTGSVIRIAPCAQSYCAQIVKLSPKAPGTVDDNNPNAALRGRQLCGLVIGTGFHLVDAEHAEGGSLYDPESGKTYHGEMTRDGDSLELRGYVGLKMFGRSETWQRTASPAGACTAKS